jgi:hypothetical protein
MKRACNEQLYEQKKKKKKKRGRVTKIKATADQTAEKKLFFELFGYDSDTADMAQSNEKLCLICEKEFSSSSYRKKHERFVHDGQKPFKCDICQKSFIHSSGLKVHQHIHTGAKPFTCELCDKNFNRPAHLKTHVRAVHEKLKPHTCNECELTFGHKINLQTHIKAVHLKMKIFKCELCESQFVRKTHLTEHLRKHSGEQPYACSQCDRRFSQVSNKKTHEALHDESKSWKVQCPFDEGELLDEEDDGVGDDAAGAGLPCGQRFKDKKTLNKHIQLSHTIDGLTMDSEQKLATFLTENRFDFTRDFANTVSHRACAELKLSGHRSRPDFYLPVLSAEVGATVLIGNDERAHRKYGCDFKRTIELATALSAGSVGADGKIIYIRVNPSSFTIDGLKYEPSIVQVHDKLLDLLRNLHSIKLNEGMNLIYLNYDQVSQPNPDAQAWSRLVNFTEVEPINLQCSQIIRSCVLQVI